ncbi:MAG TPA: phage major capsid protein [Solirubrobacteraceae bacterium]|nr:phage major capsid protein [Solirubrobacteraceae bacterium]
MATDYDALTTREVTEFFAAIRTQSVVLRLANVQRMSAGQESLPVVSFLPVAGFTNARFGGRKPATKIEWSAEAVVPREIACTFAIPRAWVDDAGFDVWGQARPLAADAIARVLDAAALFGTNAPPEFPPNGVAGAGVPLAGTDALDAIDKGMAAVEAGGLLPDGIASGTAIGSALRQEYRAQGALPSETPAPSIYGLPVVTTPVWEADEGDAIVADWTKLLVGIREDVTYDTSEDAILQDPAGVIIANAFQENLVAMRVYMRVGVAVGTPVKPDNTPADAFVAVDWTP